MNLHKYHSGYRLIIMHQLACLQLALNDDNSNTIQLKFLQFAVCISPSVCIYPRSAVCNLHFILTGSVSDIN